MSVGVIHTVKHPRAGPGRCAPWTRPTSRRAPNVAELQASLDQLMGGAAVDDCFVVPDEFAYAVSGTAGSAGV
jgi:hypothetical protein